MTFQYDPVLIDRIYEAAILPDSWRSIIKSLSDRFNAKGGLLFASTPDDVRWLGAGEAETIMVDFIAQGWPAHNDRVPRLLARQYPGFVTDTDVYTPAELAQHRMYQEFLVPRGVYAAAATAIQGASDDMLIFSIEGFPGDDAARLAIPFLDGLRPHLARAAMLASQIQLERAKAAAMAMQMIGAPAAFVSARGQLRCANSLFEVLIGNQIWDSPTGIRFADTRTNNRFRTLFENVFPGGVPKGFSIPLKPGPSQQAHVLHALPVTGRARDVFLGGGFILVLTQVGAGRRPGVDILQALFDLTPAEARLARALADGSALDEIASRFGVAVATIRSQLKALYAKIGVNRQAQLVAVLASLTLPR